MSVTAGGGGGRPGPRAVSRVLNNNLVSAIGADGEEILLAGRGIGFGAHRGDPIDEEKVERAFYLAERVRDGAARVLVDIPFPVLQAVAAAAEDLRSVDGLVIGPATEVAIADHVTQAVARLDAGETLVNPLLWETKLAYPREFACALRMLEVLRTRLDRSLPLDEAGFLTHHLVGAHAPSEGSAGLALSRTLHEIVGIVERELGVQLEADAPSSIRFLTHLKLAIQRIDDAERPTAFGAMAEVFEAEHPELHACLRAVVAHLESRSGAKVSADERMYLLIHLTRLRQSEVPGGGAAD